MGITSRSQQALDPSKLSPDNKALFNLLTAYFDARLGELNNKLDLFEKRMEANEQLVEKLSSDVATSTAAIKDLEVIVTKLQSALTIAEEKIEGQTRNSNLIINGIPYDEKENLSTVLSAISTKLGYKTIPARRGFRFGPSKRKQNSVTDRPIMLQFDSSGEKDDFFYRYLRSAPRLALDSLNLPGTSRVYIQQDLTPLQYTINREALKKKKEGKLFSVRIVGGLVSICLTQLSKPQPVSSIAALNDLIGNHQK